MHFESIRFQRNIRWVLPLQFFSCLFCSFFLPLYYQVSVKRWKGCLGFTESAPLSTVNKAALSWSSFTKDLSCVSILNSTSCLNTGIENDLLMTQDYKPVVLFFVPPEGIFFQLLSYRREAVFILALSVFDFFVTFFCTCLSTYSRSFCLLWWTVEQQHFMASDMSELCLISICWHIIILPLAT